MAESNSRRLGFLGTGNLVSAVVEGFCTSAQPPAILVSPRNEAKSRNLAERWPNVRRAGSDQDVVDGSDIVFIGLRLAVALEVLPQLRFRPDQTVVSLIPVLPYARTLALVQPASRVFRALCLPYVAKHFGQIPHFPAGDGAAEVRPACASPCPCGANGNSTACGPSPASSPPTTPCCRPPTPVRGRRRPAGSGAQLHGFHVRFAHPHGGGRGAVRPSGGRGGHHGRAEPMGPAEHAGRHHVPGLPGDTGRRSWSASARIRPRKPAAPERTPGSGPSRRWRR